MAVADKKIQPIIIKKIKKGGRGHHGGAWKIAYADFVTAMMAFFLLMWLLGSTTSGDLQGIANYFQSPLQVALSGGSGSGDASHVIKGGGLDLTRSSGQVKNGENEIERRRMNLAAAKAEQRRRERAMLEQLKAKVESVLSSNPRLMEMKSQIKLDLTVEGLRIQLVDEHNRPMFDIGSAVVKDYMREALREIGKVLNEVDNRISLSGHTDSAPYSSGERGYSNWELSADRANASRRELIAGGMDDAKIIRVLGLAAAVPAVAENPRAPSNRRISIVVMNRDAEERVLKGVEVQAADSGDLAEALRGASAGEPPQAAGADGAVAVRQGARQ
jgi:chemotaxis protein MotB